MSMRVTIKDVAREAGVAISTVSKVLNGADNLRPGTRHAVEAAIRGLNYIPNANAQSLKSRRKDAIGLFLSSIQGEFYTGMAQAIHTECMVAGFTLEIYVSGGRIGLTLKVPLEPLLKVTNGKLADITMK